MYKKIVIIILLVILVLASLTAFYFLRGVNPNTGQPKSILDYLPFGTEPTGTTNPNNSGNNIDTGNGNVSTTTTTGSANTPVPVLRKISQNPTAGAVIFDIAKPVSKTKTALSAPWEASSTVRFIEKATGHIYETTTKTNVVKKISNTTIPLIYESLWSKNGDSLIVRYLKDNAVQNYLIKLSPSKNDPSTVDVSGSFLPSDILSLAKSPLGDRLLYLLASSNGSTAVISNFDGSKKTQIWSSLFREWNISWPNENTIALNTKAGSGVSGFLYTLNIKSGAVSKVIGGISGMTSLVSPDLNYALIGIGGRSNSLRVLDIKSGAYTPANIETISEKCVWSVKTKGLFYCGVPKSIPAGNYPDDWYQGIASFSDDIWKVEAGSGTTKIIADIQSKAGEDADLINPMLSEQEDFLIFTNKKDSSLWSLAL